MDSGLTISVTELDPDYIGLTICAWNDRYSGSTFVFAPPGQLAERSDCLAGFPAAPSDERVLEFGRRREEHFAGGYCRLHFRYPHPIGGAAVDVHIEEDVQRYSESTLDLIVGTEASFVDTFVRSLRSIETTHQGVAELNTSG